MPNYRNKFLNSAHDSLRKIRTDRGTVNSWRWTPGCPASRGRGSTKQHNGWVSHTTEILGRERRPNLTFQSPRNRMDDTWQWRQQWHLRWIFSTGHRSLAQPERLNPAQGWSPRTSRSTGTMVPANASDNDRTICWPTRCNERRECNRRTTKRVLVPRE